MNPNRVDSGAADPWSALSSGALASELATIGQPRYRADQLYRGLHAVAVAGWSDLTTLSKELRAGLAERRPLRSLDLVRLLTSPLDGSRKALFRALDGGLIETVLMFSSDRENARVTICVSSQIGCPAGCTFCASGIAGFARNLTVAEITDQVELLSAVALERGRRIDNIVFMGMGEPFMNYGRVMEAIGALRSATGLNIGARHITVSTVGVVPAILRFAGEAGEVNLAISLHAPNDDIRGQLVPYNRRWPVAAITGAARRYIETTKRRVSFEYVLLENVNDSVGLGRDLARLLKPLNPLVHVNLIPWNPFPEAGFTRATQLRAEAFERAIRNGGVNATIRYSKGLDIDAACGQLRRSTELEVLAS